MSTAAALAGLCRAGGAGPERGANSLAEEKLELACTIWELPERGT